MNTTINTLQLVYSLLEMYDENSQTFQSGQFINPLSKCAFLKEVLKQKLGFFLLPDLLECTTIGNEVSHFHVFDTSKGEPKKSYGIWFEIPEPDELKKISIEQLQSKKHFEVEAKKEIIDLDFVEEKIRKSPIKEEILFHLRQDKKFVDIMKKNFENPEHNLYKFEVYKGCVTSFTGEAFFRYCQEPIEDYCILSFIKKINDKGIKINQKWVQENIRPSLENLYAPWMVNILMERINIPTEAPGFVIKETRKIAYEIFKALTLKNGEKKELKSIVLGWYEHDTDWLIAKMVLEMFL